MTNARHPTLVPLIAATVLLSACDYGSERGAAQDSPGELAPLAQRESSANATADGAVGNPQVDSEARALGGPAILIEPELRATASLTPTAGNEVEGQVAFLVADSKDGVYVRARIEGLQEGLHGFHVHENGDCSAPDASSAGGHFNPADTQHGARTDAERHVGDLGNLQADDDGIADVDFRDQELALGGPASILGKAVVVHAGPDDLESQPSGDAGSRVACGVLEAARSDADGAPG